MNTETGLTGVDPVNGVEYIDYTTLDKKMVEPFGEMFVQGDKYAAIHFFEFVQQAQMVFVSKKVLIVGTTVIYLCDPRSTFDKVVLVCNLTGLVTTSDGWVGIKVDQSTRTTDMLIKPADQAHLITILQRLYKGITSSELNVTSSRSIRSSLNLSNVGSPAQIRVIPLNYVSKDPRASRPIAAPTELFVKAGVDHLHGSYTLLPSYTEGMPQWTSSSGYTICSLNNHWVISSAPVTFHRAVMKSACSHNGVLLPTSMNEHGGWQFNRMGSWVTTSMFITTGSVRRNSMRERSCSHSGSSYPEEIDILVSTQGGTQYGVSTPRSPSSPAHKQSESGISPVASSLRPTRHVKEDAHDLVEEISQLGYNIQKLNREIDENQAKLNSYKEITEAYIEDRRAICRLFDIDDDNTGDRAPQLANVAHQALVDLMKEADEAEEGVCQAEKDLEELQVELDEALQKESSLKQQIAASRTVQQDSKEQVKTITANMQELVTRAHNAAKMKEDRVTQLGTEKAQYTKVERAYVANTQKEIAALEMEAQSLEAMIESKQETKKDDSKLLMLELEAIEAECSDLAELQETLAQKHSNALASHIKANEQVLESSSCATGNEGDEAAVSTANELTETCDQLHVAIAKMDELENEACTSGTLRWHLERKSEEVDDMVDVVRKSIFSMKELRRIYDQKLASALNVLNKKEEKLRGLQASCFRIERETKEGCDAFAAELEMLRTERDASVRGYRHEVEQIRAKAAEEENKKRWAYEQQLLMNQAGVMPNTPFQPDTELANKRAAIDERMQEIDAYMMSLQDEVLQIDNKEAQMRAKRDAAWTLLTQQEQTVAQSTMLPEVIRTETLRINGNIQSLEDNMNGFLRKTQQRREAIREEETIQLSEKQELMKQYNELRHQEQLQEEATEAELL